MNPLATSRASGSMTRHTRLIDSRPRRVIGRPLDVNFRGVSDRGR